MNTTETYNGTIANSPDGPGGIRKTGAGNQILAGQSTYTGGTRIEAGTLTVGATNALPTTGAVTLAGGTLDLAGNVQQTGAVTLIGGGITMSTPGILLPSSMALQSGAIARVDVHVRRGFQNDQRPGDGQRAADRQHDHCQRGYTRA